MKMNARKLSPACLRLAAQWKGTVSHIMKIYSIFDDFDEESISILENAGIALTVHPLGVPRPDDFRMEKILNEYDGIIIGTSQKIRYEMFKDITSHKIIATASVGVDHIQIPEDKKSLVTVYNTPKANAQSVAEYTMGVALSCVKRLPEGNCLYRLGKNNKSLSNKPEDLFGKTMGVIGAGAISQKIMEYAAVLGMNVQYWTAHPQKYNLPYVYTPLEKLVESADILSVNLPNNIGTKNFVSKDLIDRMKSNCVFISVSRVDTIDLNALIEKVQSEKNFYVNVDIDVNEKIVNTIQKKKNVFVTPHIAGGTVETRKRMFKEVSEQIVNGLN